MDPRHHSDDELISIVRRLIGAERKLTAKLVAYLAEIEERRLHLVAGYASMFDFCTRGLGLSENEAFRRIAAARIGRRFPGVHALLASGAVHLTTLELLREHLTDENHEELLAAVCGKTKREVEAVLATRFPKPDAPSKIRQLSSARFRVEFTASAELREKLELCRDLLSHANPSRDLAVVIERAVDLLLAELERTRLKRTKRPRASSSARVTESPAHAAQGRAKPRNTPITTATRREVFERDGFRCTYVSPDGRRCEAHTFLELDHRDPHALGGASDAENLRVLCRAHNQLAAEQAFGRDMVERARHFGRPKRTHPTLDTLRKLHRALTRLGFAPARAREAVAEIQRFYPTELPPLEDLLREAILIATRSDVQIRKVA
jgi:5-methylcytosine-specific restriction endonuclease McrA